MTERITQVATEYLQARDESQSDGLDLNAVRETQETWGARRAQLDENDPLYAVANENYEKLDEQVQAAERSEASRNGLKDELLETAATTFIPRGAWLDPTVLRALNLAVLGVDRDYIEIHTTRVEAGVEIEDDERLFDISMAVREVFSEARGESNTLEEFWQRFRELGGYTLFQEVVTADKPLTGTEVADRIDEAERSQAISQTLVDTTNGDVNPYYEHTEGEYSLSFIGEYLVRTFEDPESMGDEGTDAARSVSLLGNE